MKLKDTISNLDNIPIDESFVTRTKKLYGADLPGEIKRIVSLSADATVFYEDFPLLRALSRAEIEDASADMAVDFIGKGLIPLFDIGDNDYIVYDINEKAWYKFNIVDEIKFDKAEDLAEYL